MSKHRVNEIEALDPLEFVRIANLSVDQLVYNQTAEILSLTWNRVTDTYTRNGEPVTQKTTSIHRGMRRCLVNPAGQVVSYLSPVNSTMLENGTTADLQPALAAHNVMVEIPKFYSRTTFSASEITWEISTVPVQGFELEPAFLQDGAVKDYRYVGAYDASVYDVSAATYLDGLNLDDNTVRVDTTAGTGDKLASVSGKFPMVGLTPVHFRTLAKNVGSAWNQLDFWLATAIQKLYLLEYGSFNSQLKVGDGNVFGSYAAASSAAQTDSPHSAAGLSNGVGNASGGFNSSPRVNQQDWVSYRGIENFWGNCWNWLDGCNVIDNVVYTKQGGAYVYDTTSGYTPLGVALPQGGGFVRDIQNTKAFLASTITGSGSNTHITDYFFGTSSPTGNRVGLLGGPAALGFVAGVFFVGVGVSSGLLDRAVGGRLSL